MQHILPFLSIIGDLDTTGVVENWSIWVRSGSFVVRPSPKSPVDGLLNIPGPKPPFSLVCMPRCGFTEPAVRADRSISAACWSAVRTRRSLEIIVMMAANLGDQRSLLQQGRRTLEARVSPDRPLSGIPAWRKIASDPDLRPSRKSMRACRGAEEVDLRTP
jgi:hypothetical protein